MDTAWIDQVRAAASRGDQAALRALFAIAVAAEGPARASRSWQLAIAAYDAEAVTG